MQARAKVIRTLRALLQLEFDFQIGSSSRGRPLKKGHDPFSFKILKEMHPVGKPPDPDLIEDIYILVCALRATATASHHFPFEGVPDPQVDRQEWDSFVGDLEDEVFITIEMDSYDDLEKWTAKNVWVVGDTYDNTDEMPQSFWELMKAARMRGLMDLFDSLYDKVFDLCDQEEAINETEAVDVESNTIDEDPRTVVGFPQEGYD